MLSRTSTAVRGASSARRLPRCNGRANSTVSAPPTVSESATPVPPKRSIPTASAFADLVNLSKGSRTVKPQTAQRTDSGGVLRALGAEDNLDALTQLSKSLSSRINTSKPRFTQADPAAIIKARFPERRQPDVLTSHKQGHRERSVQSRGDGPVRGRDQGVQRERQWDRQRREQGPKHLRSAQRASRSPSEGDATSEPVSAMQTHPSVVSAEKTFTRLEKKRETPAKPNLPRVTSTDLSALFTTPTAPSQQVIPASIPSASLAATRVQHYLERHAGEYSRFLSADMVRGGSIGKLGAVGYARLTLARRPDVSLRQKQNAVNIINSMPGIEHKQNINIRP